MPKVKKFKKKVGSRRQVWNRTAKQTPGGLKRKDLYKDKYGSLQSRKSMKKSMKKKRKYSKKSRKSKKSRRYRRRSQKGGDDPTGQSGWVTGSGTVQHTSGYVTPSTSIHQAHDTGHTRLPNPPDAGNTSLHDNDGDQVIDFSDGDGYGVGTEQNSRFITDNIGGSGLIALSNSLDGALDGTTRMKGDVANTENALIDGYAGLKKINADDFTTLVSATHGHTTR